MGERRTRRPFQERFLDNFERSGLRREIEAVRPRRFRGFRRKAGTWALGTSLAIGGLGVPLKFVQQQPKGGSSQPSPQSLGLDQTLAGDLRAAESIARQVAGGVADGVVAAAHGVEKAATAPLAAVAEAPAKIGLITEKVREDFFRTEVPFGPIIYREAKKNNIRPELVAAVIHQESRFKPTARSGAGAVGLMQLVPRTGRWMGARDLTNPGQNIAAGTKYLKYLNDRFDGNETKVIAAYNAGEGNVKRFGGVPPFRETRNYVSKVRDYEQEYRTRVENRANELQTAPADAAR
ncbi:MAG TPA: lytic transglycosylase domain-containing protein [Thermoanaerobaculia bacterium]|nr:lytic transglycosylase domain-containing protein [Thermoanaerobaculia bacterium]